VLRLCAASRSYEDNLVYLNGRAILLAFRLSFYAKQIDNTIPAIVIRILKASAMITVISKPSPRSALVTIYK